VSVARKIKWGVIGSGGIARRRTIPEGFLPAQNAELIAVYGTNATTNRAVAEQFKVTAVESVEALLGTEIDAVYVASPVQAHVEQVVACAKAGKHVLCEKPLGRSMDEAMAMAAACEAAKVELGTAFMMRFNRQHQAAAEMIQAGRLGKPVFARAQLSFWYPPIPGAFRQDPALGGGGSLIDTGNHCLDLLEMFFGPVKSISCFTNTTIHAYKSEDSAVVALRFANGALGSVDVFFCVRDEGCRNALELYGSRGNILASGTIGQGSAGEMTAFLQEESAAPMRIAPEPYNIYRAEVEAFSESLLTGKANPIPAELGLRSQKLIAACYESAAKGRAIEV
jgi:predicted dehydrogenase